ncbi:multiple sugar transport system substrate-binding protein [Anaerotaenia torta]|uniref:extracellular solute-binding protein n=1 Tax=Anaerotaenia torta TaxID=433293 RepID=UPI003D22EA48
MKAKKLLSVLMIMVLILSTLTACQEKSTGGGNPDVTKATDQGSGTKDKDADADAKTDTDTNADANADADSLLGPMTTENITLTYACWGLGEKGETEAKDKQIEAFMKAYPNIKVEFVTIDQAAWNDGLTTMAATGTLPDVFWTFSVTDAISNQWAMDVTEFFEKDPDAKDVYPSMVENARINGRLYSMPVVMFPYLVFLNKTLFEKYNEPLPSYDWTLDQFKDIAARISHPEDFNFGTSNPNYADYFPAQYTDNESMRGWDGSNYNFGQSWIDGLNLKYDFIDRDICEWESPEDKLKWLGDEGAWPPGFGRSAMHFDWTWTIAYFEDAVKAQSGCDFLYYPQPAGPSGRQMAIVDYGVISSTTEHPREAWELQKWTSWGEEACLNRLEGYKAAGVTMVSRMPVISNQKVWDAVSAFTDREDIKEVYKRLTNVVPTVGSVAPGWSQFDAWATENGIWAQLDNREVTPAEMADTLTQKANEFKDEWLANMP